ANQEYLHPPSPELTPGPTGKSSPTAAISAAVCLGGLLGLKDQQQILGVDLLARPDQHFGDFTVAFGVEHSLHLHRLTGKQDVTRFDALSSHDRDGGDHPRHGRADMGGVASLCLAADAGGSATAGAVRHLDPAGLAVEFKEDGHHALVVGLADSKTADHQGL